MLRYAITSRALYPGDEHEKQAALLHEASRWIADGIDLIQLREKDLPAANIAALAREILNAIRAKSSPAKLLINSRPDIALATGAHGIHLTSDPDELTPTQVRSLYTSANRPAPVITISCHTLDEVHNARINHAEAILFAPIFEKVIAGKIITPGQGIDQLREACRAATPIPVYALGGITLENAPSCLAAGAAGIAGIRLFHTS
ncbi:MAG TPA: thiamine phosphate synthase [Edaphobacter sp.]|jgi:thiamine-phosphate pyrophosphorylase|nr:thiamine phosphate synthase [Edaphobacter sp.]